MRCEDVFKVSSTRLSLVNTSVREVVYDFSSKICRIAHENSDALQKAVLAIQGVYFVASVRKVISVLSPSLLSGMAGSSFGSYALSSAIALAALSICYGTVSWGLDTLDVHGVVRSRFQRFTLAMQCADLVALVTTAYLTVDFLSPLLRSACLMYSMYRIFQVPHTSSVPHTSLSLSFVGLVLLVVNPLLGTNIPCPCGLH